MKNTLLFLLISLSSNHLYAQSESESLLSDKGILRIGILGPAVGYELPVGKSATIYGELGLGALTDFENDEFDFDVVPALEIEARLFYNLEKRRDEGKRFEKNSGNFWGANIQMLLPSVVENEEFADRFAIGPVWGLQRNKDSRFSFSLSIGPGLLFSDGDTEFTVVGGLSLGFWLGSRD